MFARNFTTMTSKKTKKKTQKRTLTKCDDCPAKCCHDLVMHITKPRTSDDIDELKWELQYDTIRVFILNYRWHRIIQGRCMYLDEHNFCTIYDRRPSRCRKHNPPGCEHFGEFYDVMISTPEELDKHLARRSGR